MNNSINLSEKNLNTNINSLSREVVHDFFVVCRKAGIYSVQHPMVSSAISRPFMSMQKIFQFKKYFSLYLSEGDLFANNILMKDLGVTDYLKEKMYELEITSILFEDSLTASDLETFVDRFVKRVPTTSGDYLIHKFLEHRKVNSIKVNSELGEKLFRTGLRYRNDIGEDHSARRLVSNYFSGETQLAVNIMSSRFDNTLSQAEATGVDYHVELVKHILPEKFAQLPQTELLDMAEQILSCGSGLDENAAGRLERLVKSCDYHPKRDEILEKIREKFVERGVDDDFLSQSLSQVGSLKLEASHAVDRIYCRIFSDDFERGQYAEFHDAFIRLVRTRQLGKAASMAEVIIDRLSSDSAVYRQHAIYLLEDIIKTGLEAGEFDFFDIILRHMQKLFTQGRETFEFSQVAIHLLRNMLSLRRYEPCAAFLDILKSGRRVEYGATVYDSVTVKRIFDDLDNSEIIGRLVCELEQPGNTLIKSVREILISIQSEEVALRLAEIVTHRERSVRQHSLKILSELGWPAVKIFSDIISEETNFFRSDGKRELPDKQWFLVRNAIFVLGNLGSSKACNALRLRLVDPDIRVRRELVSALEKIGGDEAVDLLMILAEDIEHDIRESSIIALSLYQRHDLVPYFIDLLSRQKGEATRIITAIGYTQSSEGRDFLTTLLEDDERLKALSSGKASVKYLRQFILRVLEKSGDEATLKKAEEIKSKKGISTEESGLSKTAKVLLNKFQPKK